MRNKVTIADRINWFKYGSRIITLEEAMNIVKTGGMNLYDKENGKGAYNLQQATHYLQHQLLEDDIQEEKLKYLPAVSVNGVWNNDYGIVEYGSYTAIDFDHIPSECTYNQLFSKFKDYPCVAYIFRSPSGKGMKVIVYHTNNNPNAHEDLYEQLLKIFDDPSCPPDPNNKDLSRKLYLCYDSDLWVNPSPIPYHYIPSRLNINWNKNPFNLPKIGKKRNSDETCGISDISIMNMLKALCKRKYKHFLKEGARRDGAYWFGKLMSKAGVEYDDGLEFTLNLYGSDEIELIEGNPFTPEEAEVNFKNGYQSEDYSEDYRKSFISNK